MDKDKLSVTVNELREKGFNCAQTVFASSSELTGIDVKTSLKIAGGFGGGLRCGEVCGAVAGGVMAIGCMHPFNEGGDSEAKEEIAELTGQFTSRFRERFGCLRCEELKAAEKSCEEIILTAAEMVLDMQ